GLVPSSANSGTPKRAPGTTPLVTEACAPSASRQLQRARGGGGGGGGRGGGGGGGGATGGGAASAASSAIASRSSAAARATAATTSLHVRPASVRLPTVLPR